MMRRAGAPAGDLLADGPDGSRTGRRPRWPARVCLALAALVAATSVVTADAAAVRVSVGDKAPAFTLDSADKGDSRSLDTLLAAPGARGVVLIFVSARCPYVAQARQPLADLFKKHGGTKLQFVALNANQDESADDIKADAARNFPFPVLRDVAARTADLYGAQRTPEVFLIDGKGVVRYHGGVSDLAPALDSFVEGRPIAKAETKAFGCSIRRKKK